ncbi:MAG: flagellar biosynthetic protein FliR [Actinomycetota bacterium]|nr:flagellar biosynthetic protein FliR [Actinomycetota bacterium]
MVHIPVDPNALLRFVLAFVRATAWIVITPPFSNRAIPPMAKVGISAGLAMAAAGHATAGPVPLDTAGFVTALLTQVATGVALGMIVMVLFSAVEAAGSTIGMFGGFSLPPSIDLLSQNQSSALGQLYQLMAVTLLFSLGGDLLLVKGFMSSFGAVGWNLRTSGALGAVLTHDLSSFFTSALLIASPLVVVLFLAQAVLGILSRIAPQMNVMMLGFPFQILLTIGLVMLGLTVIPDYLSQLLTQALGDGNTWMRAAG